VLPSHLAGGGMLHLGSEEAFIDAHVRGHHGVGKGDYEDRNMWALENIGVCEWPLRLRCLVAVTKRRIS
jgi:hypothetical protein